MKIEYDDITTKTKLILKRFGGTFGTLNFYEKSFFSTVLGFTPFWDYKPTNAIHADRPGVWTGEKKIKFKYNELKSTWNVMLLIVVQLKV